MICGQASGPWASRGPSSGVEKTQMGSGRDQNPKVSGGEKIINLPLDTLPYGAACRVVNADGVAGKIDEQFFSRLVCLAHGDIESFYPCPVSQAELAVLVTVGVLSAVFVPEELERHVLPQEFLVYIIEGRHVAPLHRERDGGGEEKALRAGVVEFFRQGPGEPCLFCPFKAFFDGASSDPATLSRLSHGQTAAPADT